MEFSELIDAFTLFSTSLFGSFEQFFKLIFADLPKIYGLSLGWWIFGIGLFTWFVGGLLNG